MNEYTIKLNIDKDIYEKYCYDNNGSFMQSISNGELKSRHGYSPIYTGIYNNDILVGIALYLIKTINNKFKYIYIPCGFLVNNNDINIIKEYTKYTKEYCKSNNIFMFKIDSNEEYQDVDENAKPIIDGNNNKELFNNILDLGYKHLGFNKNFEMSQPRYSIILDLTKDIYPNMHTTMRNLKNRKPLVEVYKGSEEDIKIFSDLMHQTSDRQGFSCYGYDYYLDFYKTYNKYNMIDFYITKLNVKQLVETTYKNIEDLKIELETCSKKKVSSIKDQLNKLEKELPEFELLASKQDVIYLSSLLCVNFNKRGWVVHGANNDILRNLYANYYCYFAMLDEMKDKGLEYLDFFGTTGNVDKSNSVYGLHLYKIRLGGRCVEFLGEFDFPVNKFKYIIYTKLAPMLRKLLRK